jgi:hypothetical protein
MALDPPAQSGRGLAAEPGVIWGLVAAEPGFVAPGLPVPVPLVPLEPLAPPAPPPAADAIDMVATSNPTARMFF